MFDLLQIEGFDWDEGNSRKSVDKHDVSQAEAEQVFFNDPLLVVEDEEHSDRESQVSRVGPYGYRTTAPHQLYVAQ